MLIDEGNSAVAVRVDRVVGLQELVVKPLGPPLVKLEFLAGGALLADGRPAFILDVGKLVRRDANPAGG